jgi:cysteine desulfurase
MVYLDHAATTPIDERVLDAMLPWLREGYGHPFSLYRIGLEARRGLEKARERIAAFLGARATEIVFTGSGTESCNLAIKGVAEHLRRKGNHIISTTIEHQAALKACEALERKGFEVTRVQPDEDGVIHPSAVREAIRPDTILINVMHANNETGVIQPIQEIGAIAREHSIVFHTDAAMSVGWLPVDVEKLNVDMLSFSGHKFYAPKGIGGLYVRRGCRLQALIDGGGQEKNRRSGTENVAGIIGLAKACELAMEDFINGEPERLRTLRDALEKSILERVPNVLLNGHATQRLPNCLNVSVSGIEGEAVMLELDAAGICVSTGSACSSGNLDPSHVLLAMGKSIPLARGSLRFTFGRGSTMKDVEIVLDVMPPIVEKLRALSPVYEVHS